MMTLVHLLNLLLYDEKLFSMKWKYNYLKYTLLEREGIAKTENDIN